MALPLDRAANGRYKGRVVLDEPMFEVIEPSAEETPVLVEVPHAGLALDPEALAFTVAPARSLARDADLHVDALFRDAPSLGATLLYARASRYFVDLNRGETDVDAEAVEGGGRVPWARGLVWRLTTDGDYVLGQRLPRAELERRLDRVYRPYHAALQRILARKRERFGYAILLCAHSMPSQGRRGHEDLGSRRADLVPGSRGRTTAAGAVIDAVDAEGRARGWSVRHDDPYKGGFSTGYYGKPSHNIHAVQIELARRLYMDEASCRIDPQGFEGVRCFARSLVTRLATAFVDVPSVRRLGPDAQGP
jgi:N-formylglutamate amidohydrolase